MALCDGGKKSKVYILGENQGCDNRGDQRGIKQEMKEGMKEGIIEVMS